MYIYNYIYTNLFIYAYMSVNIYICIYICVYTHIYIYTYNKCCEYHIQPTIISTVASGLLAAPCARRESPAGQRGAAGPDVHRRSGRTKPGISVVILWWMCDSCGI